MASKNALVTKSSPTSARPVFTLEQANRALVLVRKVVADIVAEYHELEQKRSRRDALQQNGPDSAAFWTAQAQVDAAIDRLNTLHRELTEIGCVLKDWRTGLVDFPALRDGRRVWLCWRLGEDQVAHWHELHEGFAARRQLASAPPSLTEKE